ncbi:MAG: hypothetical protein AB1422_14370 [bacterium]
MTEVKAEDITNLNINTNSEDPLFVLRYQGWRIAWRLFWPYSIGLPLFFTGAFYWSDNFTGFKFWFVKIVSITVVFGSPLIIIEMLMTQRIELYKDRIVKVWRFGLRREVKLNEAIICGSSSWLMSQIWIARGDIPKFLSGLKGGFFYDEHLANPKMVKRFHATLSQMAGRNIGESFNKFFHTDKIILKKE